MDDYDAECLDDLLLRGSDPEDAAKRFLGDGVPIRRLEGLKTLARQRELTIMALLGRADSDILGALARGEAVEAHPRRSTAIARLMEAEHGGECRLTHTLRWRKDVQD